MSSRFRFVHASLFALSAFATGACVDPQKTFDEFADRVPDAGSRDSGGGTGLCDVGGSHLASVQTPLGPRPLRFLVTIDYTPGDSGATADVTLQTLVSTNCNKAEGGEPVGDPFPIPDIPIDADGAFEIVVEGAETPGDANPVSCQPVTANIQLVGTTQASGEDCVLCGDVTGSVMLGSVMVPLDGSTFGSVLLAPPGEDPPTGDANLPDPVTECPAGGGNGDAGPEDAG
jgi:hypothetical protein